MAKKIIISVTIFTGLFLAVSLLLPKTFYIKRKIKIYASPRLIHPYVSDLKKWPTWTPWQNEDPTIKTVIGEVSEGKGATQSWSGSAGEGQLLITSSDENVGITYEFAFNFDEELSFCSINYDNKKDATKVTWIMSGNYVGFLGGYKALLTDAMIGEMFSNGLKNLKSVIEAKQEIE